MAQPKQTKKQRLEEAREQARLAREQRERRQRMLKVLVPVLVSVGVLAVVGIIIAVVALQPKPAAAFPGGPKNMASDGIVFVQSDNGKSSQVAPTAALKKGAKPKATEWAKNDGKAHIVTYIDWTCPICKQFESTYSDTLQQAVASGDATLEVHPIGFLDANFTTPLYSTKSANVAACVANYAPEKFFDVQTEFYDNQATEQGPGLSTDKMLSLVHKAGLTNDKVDACIRGTSYEKWVKAATNRALSDDALKNPSTGQFGTPTVFVNGKRWDGQTDLTKFITEAAKA